MEDTDYRFSLALSGLWYDSATVLADPAQLDAILVEFDAHLAAEPDDVLLNIVAGVALLAAGRESEADVWLARARAGALDEWGQQYLSAVEACRDRMEAPECSPVGPFPPLE